MAHRRGWITDEEDLLIAILQDIVINGGRCDNGSFRSGTYEGVVLKMREKIPGISITTKHVQNKIKRLKDKYYYDMPSTSGFGWNDANQCVTVEALEILEVFKDSLENMNMENDDDFETEVNVPPALSSSNATSHASLSKEGEGTSKKRKRTTELNKLVKEAKDEMHETTNQMKKLVSSSRILHLIWMA